MPTGTDELDKLAVDMKAAFDDGKEVLVTVLSAMGEEQIQARSIRIYICINWFYIHLHAPGVAVCFVWSSCVHFVF